MKVTTKEYGDPERRRRKSADEEYDNKGRRQLENKEGNMTATIIRRGDDD